MKLLAPALLATLAAAGTPAAAASAQSSAPARTTRLRYVVAPTGNEARYRVREQLVGRDLPNDAIGATRDITGRIVVESDGRVVRDSSRVVVAVSGLKSDQSRRDRFLRTRTLETERFPHVELVPVALQGIGAPIAAGTSHTFSLLGELTVRGVTRPTTWQVTARADGSAVVGTATTAFTFKDFNLDQPRVPVVLSVADTVKLEYDFRLVPDSTR
jgi:polyisoprenoid-binding protein YceI